MLRRFLAGLTLSITKSPLCPIRPKADPSSGSNSLSPFRKTARPSKSTFGPPATIILPGIFSFSLNCNCRPETLSPPPRLFPLSSTGLLLPLVRRWDRRPPKLHMLLARRQREQNCPGHLSRLDLCSG